MNIKQLISDYIIQNLLIGTAQNTLHEDDQLLIDGILDSISIFQLIAFIQEQCLITIPPEDITLENFATINVIAVYLERKI
ncbi:MAG: acyl carrier protein [Methyloprofundus sp.]|nr:acyl carrier protein [Methyloprofundus sp.]